MRRKNWWDDWRWFYREARALGPAGLAIFAAVAFLALLIVLIAVAVLVVAFAIA